MSNLRNNGSGCYDPTACHAISTIDKEDAKFHKVLDTIRTICELSGFQIEGRIVLKHKKSGRVWR